MLLFQQICTSIGAAILVQGLFAYLLGEKWYTSRWVMFFGSLLTLAVLPPWRIFYSSVVLKAVGSRRTLFLSEPPLYHPGEIAEPNSSPTRKWECRISGYLDNGDDIGQLPGWQTSGKFLRLAVLASELKPDLVVVGMAERRQQMPMDEMMQLRFSGIRFEEAPITFESSFRQSAQLRHLQPSQLIFRTDIGQRRRSPFWRTSCSSCCLPCFS